MKISSMLTPPDPSRASPKFFVFAFIVIVLATILPFLLSAYQTFQLTQVLIYAIALLGLNLLTGYSGQISLGHGAFFAIGAYVTAILINHSSVPYWATPPFAAVLCLAAGSLFALPALRLANLYLSLTTFALAVALPQLLKHPRFEPWTGGSQGIVLQKPDPLFGLPVSQDIGLYFFTLGITASLFLLAHNLLRGRIGLALTALRDHPVAAASLGINIARYKTIIFGLSAMYTGIAGGLSALVVQFIAPDSFTLFLSLSFLIGIIIGGLSTLTGAIYGAFFIQFIPNLTGQISRAAPWMLYGILLIACTYAMPKGIAGFVNAAFIQTSPRRRLLAGFFGAGLIATLVITPPLALPSEKNYDTGASSSEIKIGNTMPYSGTGSAWSTIGKTEAAYFRMINDRGGVHGRKITFISLDDGYSPPKTVEATRRLLEEDRVLLMFGSLGTAPNLAVRKYLNAKKVPQLFISSGSHHWNDPNHYPWTMGLQTAYRTEAKIYASHILKNTPHARIGVLYQNDDYGKDYLAGLREGLGLHSHLIVAALSYENTDATIDSQIIELQSARAEVFLNAAGAKFAAQAIRKAAAIGWRPVHYLNHPASSISSVLLPAGLEKSMGIISSMDTKDPGSPAWRDDPAILAWFAFMHAYYPEGNPYDSYNVYAYNAAQILVQVLTQAGDLLTRENILRQATNLQNFSPTLLLPSITVNTSATDYAPLESAQLMRFDGKNWVLFGEVFNSDD